MTWPKFLGWVPALLVLLCSSLFNSVVFFLSFQEGQVLEISQVNDIRLGLAPKINVSITERVTIRSPTLLTPSIGNSCFAYHLVLF